MSYRMMMAAALVAAVSAPANADEAKVTNQPSAISASEATAARYSPERLAAIRSALSSRVAVFDPAENMMRRPTAAEEAALAAPAGGSSMPRYVALRSGGIAMRVDAANLEYLIVDLGPDGKRALRHGTAESLNEKSDGKHQGGHRHAH